MSFQPQKKHSDGETLLASFLLKMHWHFAQYWAEQVMSEDEEISEIHWPLARKNNLSFATLHSM